MTTLSIPVREQARAAGEQTPLEQRLADLEKRLARLEAAQGDGAEEDSEAACRRGVDRLSAEHAVEQCRPWCELSADERDALLTSRLRHDLTRPDDNSLLMAMALEVVPDLVRALAAAPRSELEALRGLRRVALLWREALDMESDGEPGAEAELAVAEENLCDALQTLDELDDDEIPDEPAPAPSEAAQTIWRLREAESDRDQARRQNERLRRRLRELAPGPDDSERLSVLLQRVAARCSVYDRLAAREAYDVHDPEALVAVVLGAREEVRRLTAELDAVGELTDAVEPHALRRIAEGLHLLGDADAEEVAALLEQLAQEEPCPDSSQRADEPTGQLPSGHLELYQQLQAAAIKVERGAAHHYALSGPLDDLWKAGLEPEGAGDQPGSAPCSAAEGSRTRPGASGVPSPTPEPEALTDAPTPAEAGPVRSDR